MSRSAQHRHKHVKHVKHVKHMKHMKRMRHLKNDVDTRIWCWVGLAWLDLCVNVDAMSREQSRVHTEQKRIQPVNRGFCNLPGVCNLLDYRYEK